MVRFRISSIGRSAAAMIIAGSLSLSLADTAAMAQDAEDFYAGKTITIYVGFAPGAGYDMYGRLAAEFIGRHIPGNPEVIVENMPGAGGRRAAQYLYARAPQDGTALSIILQSIAADSVAGTIPGVEDGGAFNAVGRITSDFELGLAWHTAGVESFEQSLTQELAFGSTGGGSPSYFIPAILNDLEGAKYNIIQGYEGGSTVRLAMEAGEVEGMMSALLTVQSSSPEWFTDGLVNVLWQLSNEPHPDFPDVTAIGQLGDNEDEKAMYRLLAGASDIARSLFTTPNVPDDRLAILREAFTDMVQDPDFLAAAEERNLAVNPLSGEELQALFVEQMDVPDGAVTLLRTYLRPQ